jgi:hypothetical protein
MLPLREGVTMEYSHHRVCFCQWKEFCKINNRQLAKVLGNRTYPNRAKRLETLMDFRRILVQHRPRNVSLSSAKAMLRVHCHFKFLMVTFTSNFYLSGNQTTDKIIYRYLYSHEYAHISIFYTFQPYSF